MINRVLSMSDRRRSNVLRVFSIVLLIIVSLATTTACQLPSGDQSLLIALDGTQEKAEAVNDNQKESVIITFACPGWLKPEVADLAQTFHESHPNIQVQLVAIEDIAQYGPDYDYADTTRQIVSSADAAQWQPTPLAAREGLLLDLALFIESDGYFRPEGFYPQMLESVQWDGGTWGLPSQGTLVLLYYNKTAFDAAGVAYPQLGWAREAFLVTAQQLTHMDNDKVIQYGFVDYAGGMLNAAVTGQVSTAHDDAEFIPPQFSNPDVSAAMQWYTDLALEYQVMPNPVLLSDDKNERAQTLYTLVYGDFADAEDGGRAAMWTDLLSNYSMSTQLHERVGIAPLPGKGKTSPFSLWESYIVSAGTPYPEETWQWLTFLAQQPASGRMMSNDIPAYRSVAEQNHYWVRWQEEETEVIQYALENAITTQVAEVAVAIRKAAEEVFAGKTVDAALQEAQTEVMDVYSALAEATPGSVVVKTPEPSPPGTTTINFATVQTSEYRALTTAFHEMYPNIRVNVVRPDAGEPYDCFVDQRFLAQDGSRDELLKLQPLVEADTDFSLDVFNPRALEALQYQGDLWGIPVQATATAIFYNRDLFEAEGLPYPEPGWSLEDFQQAAIALSHGEGETKQYGYVPLAYAFDVQVFLALQDVSLWDVYGNPSFDTPEVSAVVQWYADLVRLYGAFPQELGTYRQTLIRQGRAGMWSDVIGDPYDYSTRGPKDTAFGIAPLPAGVKTVSGLAYEGFFIASESLHSEVCWLWMQFASQQISPLHGVPARRDHLASADFEAQVGEEAAATYRAMLAYDALPALTSEQQQILRTHFEPAIEQIVGGAPVAQTLSNAQHNVSNP